jgi:hypothetical protein
MVSLPNWMKPSAWTTRPRASHAARMMHRADAIVTIRSDLADRFNALGIGGILPRSSFEQPIADALGLDEFMNPASAEDLVARTTEKISALVSQGRRPVDALRSVVEESARTVPQLRTPAEARDQIARMIASPDAPTPGENPSEEEILARIAAAQRPEPASHEVLAGLGESRIRSLVDLYNQLLWTRMGPKGLLQPADYEAVRAAVVATFVALSGRAR